MSQALVLVRSFDILMSVFMWLFSLKNPSSYLYNSFKAKRASFWEESENSDFHRNEVSLIPVMLPVWTKRLHLVQHHWYSCLACFLS